MYDSSHPWMYAAPRSTQPPLPPIFLLSTRPPTRERASSTGAFTPRSRSHLAAASPAGPAPTMRTRDAVRALLMAMSWLRQPHRAHCVSAPSELPQWWCTWRGSGVQRQSHIGSSSLVGPSQSQQVSSSATGALCDGLRFALILPGVSRGSRVRSSISDLTGAGRDHQEACDATCLQSFRGHVTCK